MTQTIKEKIPDWLSISRMILVVPACILFLLAENSAEAEYRFTYFWSALVICVLAGLTDFLDGYLARKWKRRNEKREIADKTGAKLDPIADKIFTYPVLLVLLVPPWLIVFMFIRDLLVTFFRVLLERRGLDQKTSIFGKIKTFVIFISIFAAIFTGIYLPEINVWKDWYITNLLFILTLITLIHYTWDWFYLSFVKPLSL